MTMKHTMVDLETLGTGARAAILSIGAVKFNSKGLGEEFYSVIDMETCQQAGLTITMDTIVWWMQQEEQARAAFTEKHKTSLFQGLKDFATFLGPDAKNMKVWGNGASFDNVILAEAYNAVNLDLPWKFWNDRCYRTMNNMFGRSIPMDDREGTYHNALDDAINQAHHLVKILQAIS
jgi:hypothetical protein